MLPGTMSGVSEFSTCGLPAIPYSPPMFQEIRADVLSFAMTPDERSYRNRLLNNVCIPADDPEWLKLWVFFLARC